MVWFVWLVCPFAWLKLSRVCHNADEEDTVFLLDCDKLVSYSSSEYSKNKLFLLEVNGQTELRAQRTLIGGKGFALRLPRPGQRRLWIQLHRKGKHKRPPKPSSAHNDDKEAIWWSCLDSVRSTARPSLLIFGSAGRLESDPRVTQPPSCILIPSHQKNITGPQRIYITTTHCPSIDPWRLGLYFQPFLVVLCTWLKVNVFISLQYIRHVEYKGIEIILLHSF